MSLLWGDETTVKILLRSSTLDSNSNLLACCSLLSCETSSPNWSKNAVSAVSSITSTLNCIIPTNAIKDEFGPFGQFASYFYDYFQMQCFVENVSLAALIHC